MTDAEVNTKTVIPPSPPKTWDVTQFALRLDTLLLQEMKLDGVHTGVDPMPAAKLDSTPSLVPGSWGDTSFEVHLRWEVLFEGDEQRPFGLSGCHLLKFRHKEGLPEEGASYYAMVNSFIFAYPYLRQLVNEIASWAIGKALILEPLDVPKYVRDQVKVFREARDRDAQRAQGAPDEQDV